MDVQKAIKKNNLMIPTGTAKIGDIDYMVDMANMVESVPEFDDIVVKVVGGRPVYVRDVGHVEDSSAIQTNIVRISRSPGRDSKRQVYVPIFRRPGANTIDVVNGVRERIPEFPGRLPNKKGYTDPDTGKPASGLNLDVVADQSVFVRKAIRNLTKEGILGAVLASYFLSRILSPAFCAYFLKAHNPNEMKFFLFALTDSAYEAVRSIYVGLLRAAVRVRWLTAAAALGLVIASLPLYSRIGR